MKNLLILSAMVVLLLSCATEEKRELKGYKFNKEGAQSTNVKSNKLTRDLSLDMYVMLHSYPKSWTSIISKFKNDQSCEFNLRIKNGEIGQFYYGDGKKNYAMKFNSKDVLPLNTWVRLTAVKDMKKKELVIYANGKKVAQRSFRNLPQAQSEENSIVIAALGKKSLNATFAEVRIWNKALSMSDIQETGGIIKTPAAEKNLFAYWMFDNVQSKEIENLTEAKLDLKIQKAK